MAREDVIVPNEVFDLKKMSKNKMKTSVKVEIIKRETIKPSSPTPHHLRNFKLSRLDQFAPLTYISQAYFYPLDGHGGTDDHKFRSHRLKESLSETLTHFYPLAGRVKDNAAIDCNDDGVEFVEARVDRPLLDIFERPEVKVLDSLVPIGNESTEAVAMGCLLLVQASFFQCGGMTVGISISHKIADAYSLCSFIKAWATTTAAAHGSSSEAAAVVVLPEFNIVSLFPPPDSPIKQPTRPIEYMNCKIITNRYVFDATKIALLKTKAASASVPRPTRVEAVSALLWKCAVAASSASKLEIAKRPVLLQLVDLRKKIASPSTDSSFGNLIGSSVVLAEESEMGLDGLVGLLRKGIKFFSDSFVDKFSRNDQQGLFAVFECANKEEGKPFIVDDVRLYTCSSCCRLPLYEVADFGWGKPTWVTSSSKDSKNVILLMDARDGVGIEAWVNLSEEDMALFERDQELLAFASLNPSVCLKLDMVSRI